MIMEGGKSVLISTATVKTVAVLIAKSYIVIALSVLMIGLFTSLSGALSFQSVNIFKLSSCSAETVLIFKDYNNISFSFSDEEERSPTELIYTIMGLNISEDHYSDLRDISKLLQENNCEISSVKLERGHIFSSNPISDVAIVIWILISSLLIALMFRKSIQNDRPLHKKTYLALPFFGVLGAIFVTLLINLYISMGDNPKENYFVDDILNRISFIEAFLIGVIVIPLFEEIIFRRVVLQLWINKSFVVLGVIFSSVAFAALHVLVPQEILPKWLVFFIIFMLSVGCSYAYLRSGLKGSWLLHASYNASLIIPLYLI